MDGTSDEKQVKVCSSRIGRHAHLLVWYRPPPVRQPPPIRPCWKRTVGPHTGRQVRALATVRWSTVDICGAPVSATTHASISRSIHR